MSENIKEEILLNSNIDLFEKPEIHEMKCFEIFINSIGEIKFVCLICNETFNQIDNIIRHIQIDFFTTPQKCNDCNEELLKFDMLLHSRKHNKDNCSPQQLYENTTENIFIATDADTIEKEENIIFDCLYCTKQFDNPHSRLKHFVTAHINNEELFCKLCNKWFTTLNDRIAHNIIHRKKKFNIKKRSTTVRRQNRTQNIKTNDLPKISKKTGATVYYENGKRKRIYIKRLMCHYCGKKFAEPSKLTLHYSVHTGEKNYKCPLCDKTFTQPCYIKQHMRFHTGERPYPCTVCEDKKFVSAGALRNHMVTHSGIKRYKCSTCDKAFLRARTLADHLRVHTGEKPYKCAECGTSFAKRSTLREHKKLHSSVKSYKCKYCDKSFAQLAGVYGHQKTHR